MLIGWLLFTFSSTVLGHSVQLHKEEEVGIAWHRWADVKLVKPFFALLPWGQWPGVEESTPTLLLKCEPLSKSLFKGGKLDSDPGLSSLKDRLLLV